MSHYAPIDRNCSTCGVAISRGSRSGKCVTCYHDHGVFSVKPSPRVWCLQCDRNVTIGEAGACASAWCKAKGVAA